MTRRTRSPKPLDTRCLLNRVATVVLLTSAAVLGSVAVAPCVVIAQATTDGPVSAAVAPRSEDVATIDGIIRAFYEVVSGPAGARPDIERDRTLHHPAAWVAIAGAADRSPRTVNVTDLDGYHGANAPRQQPFYEWETERVVQRSGDMVHVWSHYASAREPDGEPFDGGVNSITLFWDGERWWIVGWMFDPAG